MSSNVRVRFAPSPTGFLHVGAFRSALFNWLWARHNQGVFIVRLEDTDRARLVEGAQEQILASFDALGLTPDEGPVQGGPHAPYVQSERLPLYAESAEILLASGALYPCWCSPERLDGLRTAAQKAGTAFKYDRYCLDHPLSVNEPHVLRFKIPAEPLVVSWDDAVRGTLSFNIVDLDDFVAIKSDSFPTYHFANVVDDHDMAISHVLRADEWLPSTPKHLLMFAAFGWDAPIYAHLPAVQGPDGGKKLSKRDGARSVQEFLADGYLPEALLSFLATLGWNDGTTKETYSLDELIQAFSLKRIQRSPARFDQERLTWTNGWFIRQLPLVELEKRCEAFWPSEANKFDPIYRQNVLGLVQERLKSLGELPELTEFFFVDPTADPALLTKTLPAETAAEYLREVAVAADDTDWSEAQLDPAIRAIADLQGLKTGVLFGLIRVAITGRTAAPGLFETMIVLNRESTLRRLNSAAKSLSKP